MPTYTTYFKFNFNFFSISLLLKCLKFVLQGNFSSYLSALRDASNAALSGQRIYNRSIEQALITNFELLNLVPADQLSPLKSNEFSHDSTDYSNAKQNVRKSNIDIEEDTDEHTKWRRVGLVTGSAVRLDTIVWPGGDIVVSGGNCFFFSNHLDNHLYSFFLLVYNFL